MNAQIDIRRVTIDDKSDLQNLTMQMGYPSSEEKITEILKMVINHDDHQIFVAEFANRIVGYAHLVKTIQLGSGPYVEIAALIVDEKSRNIGAGKKLIQEAAEWAKESSHQYIRIRSSIIQKSAYKFFEKHGFKNFQNQEIFIKEVVQNFP